MYLLFFIHLPNNNLNIEYSLEKSSLCTLEYVMELNFLFEKREEVNIFQKPVTCNLLSGVTCHEQES